MSDNTHTKDIVLNKDTKGDTLPVFLLRKNQRLTSAVYMVTGYLSDQDPLKWKLRSVSLDIVSALSHMDPGAVKDKESATNFYNQPDLCFVLDRVGEMMSLMDIAMSSGSVSQMNFSILRNEYSKIKNLLEKTTGGDYWGDYLLSAETDTQAKELASSFEEKASLESKGQTIKDTKQEKESFKTQSTVISKTTKKISSPKGQTGQARQESIKSFLTGKEGASIKDIASAIPDCGLKTIQRELADMVIRGVLDKRGDRRWARYSLSHN